MRIINERYENMTEVADTKLDITNVQFSTYTILVILIFIEGVRNTVHEYYTLVKGNDPYPN